MRYPPVAGWVGGLFLLQQDSWWCRSACHNLYAPLPSLYLLAEVVCVASSLMVACCDVSMQGQHLDAARRGNFDSTMASAVWFPALSSLFPCTHLLQCRVRRGEGEPGQLFVAALCCRACSSRLHLAHVSQPHTPLHITTTTLVNLSLVSTSPSYSPPPAVGPSPPSRHPLSSQQ